MIGKKTKLRIHQILSNPPQDPGFLVNLGQN
jgi:hypothetical protein